MKHAETFFDRFKNSPCAIANGLNDIFQKVVRGCNYMDVTTQSGANIVTRFGSAYIEPDWENCDGYVFTNDHETLDRYETAEQVIDVITALRDAIKRGDTEFKFPTVDELSVPTEAATHDTGDDELIDPSEIDSNISKQIADVELNIGLAEVAINRINDKFLESTACEMDDYDTYLIGKLQAQIAAYKVKLAKLKASLEADKNVEPSATEKPTPRKKTTSRLSTAAQRYLNREKAREEAQERKARREWQWEMEQRFYPN